MENNRPKISSLSEKELATLLTESFFKIGKSLKLQASETKIFLSEVYKFQGWMYVDTFSDAFSRYAACELPDAESLRPYVSPIFVSKLMKIYFKKCSENKFITKSVKDIIYNLSPKEKYLLFIKHILATKCVPANPDWICVYEYLSEINKINLFPEWASLSYSGKLKQAIKEVTEWAYKNFTITENLLYKNMYGTLHGVSKRL